MLLKIYTFTWQCIASFACTILFLKTERQRTNKTNCWIKLHLKSVLRTCKILKEFGQRDIQFFHWIKGKNRIFQIINNRNSWATKLKIIKFCQNWIFLFILKVANIRCFILIKCSEQEVRFKKYAIMS
jgi:hypothetical protein